MRGGGGGGETWASGLRSAGGAAGEDAQDWREGSEAGHPIRTRGVASRSRCASVLGTELRSESWGRALVLRAGLTSGRDAAPGAGSVLPAGLGAGAAGSSGDCGVGKGALAG